MLRRILLLFLLILTCCWFGALYDKEFSGLRFAVSDDSLFLGLSILMGSGVIALVSLKSVNHSRIPSDYLGFVRLLEEKGPLSADEIEALIGTTEQLHHTNGEQTTQRHFSAEQRQSLEQLAYEGKLRFQGDRYSLPEQ